MNNSYNLNVNLSNKITAYNDIACRSRLTGFFGVIEFVIKKFIAACRKSIDAFNGLPCKLISREGETVLIEPNIGVGTWMMQVASGTPTFGEFSDEVRDYIQRRIKDGNY